MLRSSSGVMRRGGMVGQGLVFLGLGVRGVGRCLLLLMLQLLLLLLLLHLLLMLHFRLFFPCRINDLLCTHLFCCQGASPSMVFILQNLDHALRSVPIAP